MHRRSTRQHHRNGSRTTEQQADNLSPREAVDARRNRYEQHDQRSDGSDNRAVDWRGARESLHEQHLSQHAYHQRSDGNRQQVRAFDTLARLPRHWYERQQCRHDERAADHRFGCDVASEYKVVEGVVARPNDVAEEQCQVRAELW